MSKKIRVIEGDIPNIRNYNEYYKKCFLCGALTCDYYISGLEDPEYVYKIYLCLSCQQFRCRICPDLYLNSIDKYIRYKWGVFEEIQERQQNTN